MHEVQVYKCHRCDNAEDFKEVNTVEVVYEFKIKCNWKFSFKLKFSFKFKCKICVRIVTGDSFCAKCNPYETENGRIQVHKMSEDFKEVKDNTEEVSDVAENGEVAKVGASVTPPAMIWRAEPRAHDPLIMCFAY